jgi:hypothetical protein
MKALLLDEEPGQERAASAPDKKHGVGPTKNTELARQKTRSWPDKKHGVGPTKNTELE